MNLRERIANFLIDFNGTASNDFSQGGLPEMMGI